LASKKAGEDIVLRAVHNATKKVVQADAKRLAPGNNGELRNSIKTRVKMDGDKAIGEVYTNLHYAPYVEFGTGPKGQASHSGISPEVSVSYRSNPWYVHEDQINCRTLPFSKNWGVLQDVWSTCPALSLSSFERQSRACV